MTGHIGFLGYIFPWLIFIIFLCWCLSIWVCNDNSFRYWSLDLSYLSGNFITVLLFAVCIFREFWLTVAPFTDLFGGYVQEGMIANVESWKMWQTGRYDLSNPPGNTVSREVKLSLVFLQC